MAKGGVKRASPGADDEKNPLANVDLSEEDAKNLTKAQRDLGRVELAMGLYLHQRPNPRLSSISSQTV
jgi:template-activating factor I